MQNAINLTRYEFLKCKVTRDKVSSNPQNSVVDFFGSDGQVVDFFFHKSVIVKRFFDLTFTCKVKKFQKLKQFKNIHNKKHSSKLTSINKMS